MYFLSLSFLAIRRIEWPSEGKIANYGKRPLLFGQGPGFNKRPGEQLRGPPFYMLHAPCPLKPGRGELGWCHPSCEVVQGRRPECVSGLEGCGANILEGALYPRTVASCEGPGNTTCINQALELKEMPLWYMDLITLEKYKTCSSFHSFSSLTHIHRDTHFNLVSGSVIWCRSKSWRHEIQGTILAFQDWMQVAGEGSRGSWTQNCCSKSIILKGQRTQGKKKKNTPKTSGLENLTWGEHLETEWSQISVFSKVLNTVNFGHGPLNSFTKPCVLTMFKNLQLVVPTTVLTVWRFFLEINNQCGFTLTGFGDDTKVSFCQLKGTF